MHSTMPPLTLPLSDAERTIAARIGGWLFRYRGALPIPLALAALLLPAEMLDRNWALGLLLIGAGEALRLWGVAAAGPGTRRRTRRVETLVTHGPFAHLRNPLYLGNALIWIGFVAIANIPQLTPIALAAFALQYSAIVHYEEAVLASTFGDRYLRYKARTPRWLPGRRTLASDGPLAWYAAFRSERSTFLQFTVLLVALAIKGWKR